MNPVFSDIQISCKPDVLPTVVLVPADQQLGAAAGAGRDGYCVLWVCHGKKVEFFPSWAPTDRSRMRAG